MNLRWNEQNIYNELNKITKRINNTNNEDEKLLLYKDVSAYFFLLKLSNVNSFGINAVDFMKYKNIYEKNFEIQQNKLIEVIYNRYYDFSSLINNISNMNFKFNNSIPTNNFIIDSKLFNYKNIFKTV